MLEKPATFTVSFILQIGSKAGKPNLGRPLLAIWSRRNNPRPGGEPKKSLGIQVISEAPRVARGEVRAYFRDGTLTSRLPKRRASMEYAPGPSTATIPLLRMEIPRWNPLWPPSSRGTDNWMRQQRTEK